jgi:hypothetical protein
MTLTVAQLIEQLRQFDFNAEVWVATECHGCFKPANKVSRDNQGRIVIEDTIG